MTLTLTGLPHAGGYRFAANSVAAGSSTDLTIWASTPASDIPILINGTSGTLQASRTLRLTAQQPASLPMVTNRSTAFYTEEAPRMAVYDALHKLIFATNQRLNQIEVFSAETRQRLAPIPFPQPWSLDLSPDNTRLWVGTNTEYFYAIDTSTLQVVERITPPRNDYFWPNTIARDVVATANGSLLLRLGEVNLTNERLYQYFPSTASFVQDPGHTGSAQRFLRSRDGSKVLFGLYVYDAATDTFLRNDTTASPLMTVRPDGRQFVAAIDNGFAFLDAELNILGQVTLPPQRLHGRPMYSADGRYLFVPKDISGADSRISVIDAESFAIVGAIPDVFHSHESGYCDELSICDSTFGGSTPFAADDSGLLVGGTPDGISLLESTPIADLPPPTHFLDAFPYATNPAVGDPTEVTDVVVRGGELQQAKIAFGQTWATVLASGQFDVEALAPPSKTLGPVNVFAEFPDGWSTLGLNAFSYGPQVSYIVPGGGRTSGGGTVTIVGYGFGTSPSLVSVQIGGRAATVEDVRAASGSGGLFRIVAQIPPGSPGPQNVRVTTPGGTTVIANGFHYLQNVEDYAIGGFTQLLFDTRREQLYLLNPAATSLAVFSTAARQLRSPIVLGGTPSRMALLPDGSRIAVLDSKNTIILVDPDNPSNRTTINVASANGTALTLGASADGKLFVGYSYNSFGTTRVIDLETLVSDVSEVCAGSFCQIESARNGSRVFFAEYNLSTGYVSSYDALNHTFVRDRAMQEFLSEMAVAGDGYRWLFNYNFLDTNNTIESIVSISQFIVSNTPYAVYGRRLHDSGGLMYLPLTDGLHIYDTEHGRLLRSYAGMRPTEASVRDTIALDESGQRVFALTADGLEIVTLDSVPLSIGHALPSVVPVAVPTQVTIRGSGFNAETQVVIDGGQVESQFVDANTLRVIVNSNRSGVLTVIAQNPDGERFESASALRAN